MKNLPPIQRKLSSFLASHSRKFLAGTMPPILLAAALSTSGAATPSCAPSPSGGHMSGPGVLAPGTLAVAGHLSMVINGHYNGSLASYTHCSHANR